jgi:hypothetical protein
VGDTAFAPSLGNEKKKKVYVSDSDAALESFIPGMNFRINNEFLGNTGTVAAGNIEQPVATAVMKAVAPEKVVVSSLMRGAIRDPVVASSYEKSMNGTWDLLVSLADTQPYTAKRYESGMMRRIVDMPNESCIEVVPVMWGLSTARQWSELKWNAQRTEALMSGPQVVQSQAPWQTKNKDQTFQVRIYVGSVFASFLSLPILCCDSHFASACYIAASSYSDTPLLIFFVRWCIATIISWCLVSPVRK